MPKIVVLGSGFGSVAAVREISRSLGKNDELIVVSRNKDFVFVPLIHEIIAGDLAKEDISIPVKTLGKFTFVQSKVGGIDFKKRIVKAGANKIRFDYLLIAIGSVPNKGILPKQVNQDELLTLKTIEDAELIRRKLAELASNYKNKKTARLGILIIGAGATGIETAGEISSFLRKSLGKSSCNGIEICLTEKNPDILGGKDEKFNNKVKKRLEKLRIKILYSSGIASFENGKAVIEMQSGKEEMYVSLALLAAGVKPAPVETIPKKTNEKGAFEVNEFLEVKNTENVWAVGDIACCINSIDKKPVPMLAQAAYSMGYAAGKNMAAKIIGKNQKSYSFRSKGFLLSVGRYAVGDIFGLTASGYLVWWLKRAVYAFEFPGFKNKLKAFWKMGILSLIK